MSDIEHHIGWLGPCDSYWGWILEHLGAVKRFPETSGDLADALSWLQVSEERILLVGLASRQSTLWNWIQPQPQTESLHSGTPKRRRKKGAREESQIALILGESWEGHRRTYPLPETSKSFYWYELFDRLLPSLSIDSESIPKVPIDSNSRATRWLELSAAQEGLDLCGLQALLVSDAQSVSSMWVDVLKRKGAAVLVDDPGHAAIVRYEPQLVIIDLSEGYRFNDHRRRLGDEIKKIKSRFPHALTIVADSFPRWNDWHNWSEQGADILLPKPFCSLGIIWAARQWCYLSNT